MIAFHFWSLWPLLFLLNYSLCQRIEWDASNFPNPTTGDFKRCNMRTTASICDPDAVLTEQQRYRLNHELHQLESRTRQDHAPDFCQKKGITAAMGIAKHVRGGSERAVRDMANEMLNKWSLDDQCQKSVVIVVATEDKRFWVARSSRVPVYAAEFNQIFADQRPVFERGDYAQALGNIMQQTWEKALSKQGPRGDGGGGSGGRGGYDGGMGGHGGKSGGTGGGGVDQPGFKMPSVPRIPIWVWLAIICAIIPLLCCCCLCYCCFCRKSGATSSARRQLPSDIEGSGGMGGGSGVGQRGRGGGLNSFLGGLGGAGIGSLAGRLLSGGGGGRRGMRAGEGDPGYQGGGTYPAGPYHPPAKDENRGGLYPNVPVADEGGGGSWGGK